MKPSYRYQLHRLAEDLVTPQRFSPRWGKRTVKVEISAADHVSTILRDAEKQIEHFFNK